MSKLMGKVIAVTGAASGIGRALAQDLASRGADLALSDVDEDGLAKTATLVGDAVRVTTACVDVRDADAVDRWAAQVVHQHGWVDGIINNAGLAVRDSVAQMDYEKFKLVIDVDMWGVVHGVRAFLPHLRRRGGGYIVNISSINGMVPFANNGPYNMSKYAVLGLSETLMQELREEPIIVTCVHPGGIRTNIVRNAPGMGKADAAIFDRIAMTSAQGAARQILDGMERGRARVYVGADAKFMAAAKRLLPAATVGVVGRLSAIATRGENDATRSRRVWIDHSVDLAAPLHEVEGLLRDIDGWTAWTPGLLRLRRDTSSPVAPGETFMMVLKAKGAPPALVPCKVLRWEPGLIEWGGGVGSSKVRHSFTCEALDGGGTRVRQVEYATGVLAQAMRPIERIAARHNRAWSDALERRFGALHAAQ